MVWAEVRRWALPCARAPGSLGYSGPGLPESASPAPWPSHVEGVRMPRPTWSHTGTRSSAPCRGRPTPDGGVPAQAVVWVVARTAVTPTTQPGTGSPGCRRRHPPRPPVFQGFPTCGGRVGAAAAGVRCGPRRPDPGRRPPGQHLLLEIADGKERGDRAQRTKSDWEEETRTPHPLRPGALGGAEKGKRLGAERGAGVIPLIRRRAGAGSGPRRRRQRVPGFER